MVKNSKIFFAVPSPLPLYFGNPNKKIFRLKGTGQKLVDALFGQ